METAQLAIGADLLGHARDVASDPKASNRELRFTVARLSECLYDALRVADSRGARLSWYLPDPESDETDVAADDERAELDERPQISAEACGVQ
ncbi:hypothetical protein [Streptomyces formicae]|uniref:hypothetical protein n=1 Tax=Streptomyces formicae TaxID=1616117 RepID=UPI0030D9AF5F